MIHTLSNTGIKFELGKTYRISLKNGVQAYYKIVGMHNPRLGKPALRLVNKSYGWIQYISVEDIKSIE